MLSLFALVLCFFSLFINGDDSSASPFYTRIVYVQAVTPSLVPDGSITKPYSSILSAMASITDMSPSKRYVIQVSPGSYTESETVHLKPNVFIKGTSKLAVRLNINWDLNDPAWFNPSASTDDRSGFESVSLVGSVNNANFFTQSSGAGKLYLFDTRMNNALSVVAYGPISQVVLQNSQFFSNATFVGMNTEFNGAYFVNAGTVSFVSTPVSQTLLDALGGACDGTFSVTFNGGSDQVMKIVLANFALTGSLVASGASAVIQANTASSPGSSRITTSGGATLSFYNL